MFRHFRFQQYREDLHLCIILIICLSLEIGYIFRLSLTLAIESEQNYQYRVLFGCTLCWVVCIGQY